MTVTLEEAAMRLPELVRSAASGEEVVLTEGGVPVARLVAYEVPSSPGSTARAAEAAQRTVDE